MTTRTVLALALGVTALTLMPTTPAQAAATCLGQPATIEASSGTVDGTPAADVIVATGSVTAVNAGEGDDLICVATTGGDDRWVDIAAGSGDDRVDATGAGTAVEADLGAGDDTYQGGAGTDYVGLTSGGWPFAVIVDPGADVVGTGAGEDVLGVPPGAVLDADLGAGRDRVSFSTTHAGPGSTFDLGSGRDSMGFEDDWETPGAGDTTLLVNLPQEVLEWRGVRSVLRGAEDVRATARTVVFRGNDRANALYTFACNVRFRGGNGDDTTSLKTIGIYDTQPFDCRKGDVRRAYGNRGVDDLAGGRSHDVLIGGPGRDKAYGGPDGHDVCVAEVVSGKGCAN